MLGATGSVTLVDGGEGDEAGDAYGVEMRCINAGIETSKDMVAALWVVGI